MHARGFEPLQMENMIRQYVQEYGRITRRDVVELCRVSSHQAYYLLRKLHTEGQLEMAGSGRNVYYTLPRTEKNAD